jgi:hypothetical protein
MLKKVCAERGMVTDGWISLDPADLCLVEGVYKKNIRTGQGKASSGGGTNKARSSKIRKGSQWP